MLSRKCQTDEALPAQSCGLRSPLLPLCTWPSLGYVCVDLVLNEGCTQASMWPLGTHQYLQRRKSLHLVINVPSVSAQEEAVCISFVVPRGAQRLSVLVPSSTSSLPLWHAGLRMEMIIWIELEKCVGNQHPPPFSDCWLLHFL